MKLEWNEDLEEKSYSLTFNGIKWGYILIPDRDTLYAERQNHFSAFSLRLPNNGSTLHKTLEEAKGALLLRIFRFCSEIMLEIREHEEFRNFQGKFSQ